jgi:hypothetical protein
MATVSKAYQQQKDGRMVAKHSLFLLVIVVMVCKGLRDP